MKCHLANHGYSLSIFQYTPLTFCRFIPLVSMRSWSSADHSILPTPERKIICHSPSNQTGSAALTPDTDASLTSDVVGSASGAPHRCLDIRISCAAGRYGGFKLHRHVHGLDVKSESRCFGCRSLFLPIRPGQWCFEMLSLLDFISLGVPLVVP